MAGTLTISTLSDGTNSTSSTNCIQGSAKAWLCYNGGTAIRASYNVSSITVNGTGDYTVNFTNALTDANYSLVGTSSVFSSGAAGATVVEVYAADSGGTNPTASAARIYVHRSAVGAVSSSYVNISVFR